MKIQSILGLLTLAVAANAAVAAGDAGAGKAKAAVCMSCHGADGNSTNPEWPKLAGQHASYTEKQLADFKAAEQRSNSLMAGMVAALSPQDMQDLAAYYATQQSTGGFASEERVALGQKLYRGGNLETGVPACISCHGPKGQGDPAAAIPALAGQHAKYTATQLAAFRSGARSNDRNEMMRGATRWMSEKEVDAVAEYIAGLH